MPPWQAQTDVRLERRHHWGRWIDDLVAEEVDTDHDGTVETTLWPITDLLGNVELLTDSTGRIVERMIYDPDGTPHVFGEDTTRPAVTRIAWTGSGASPAGDVTAEVFEVGLSEAIDEASLAGVVATFTPQGGSAQTLTVTLTPDRRGLLLSDAVLTAGQPATLHLEGPADPTGNTILARDDAFTLADVHAYAVLVDEAAPTLTAVFDTTDGLLLAFDEPVVAAAGHTLNTAVIVSRSGLAVDGTTARLAPGVLEWSPASTATWQLGGEYRIGALHLQDTSVEAKSPAAPTLPLALTHLSSDPAAPLVAYAAPTDAAPRATSAYRVTTLFQGRDWHRDLGMYYCRARWYEPQLGSFVERDPLGHADSPSRYQAFQFNGLNVLDPSGKWDVSFHWYVVYGLASLATWDHSAVFRIAWASQQVDEDLSTFPGIPRPDSLKFHFPDPSGSPTKYGLSNAFAVRLVDNALARKSDLHLGAALHTLADSFSHAGYSWRAVSRDVHSGMWHFAGHIPEWGARPDNLKHSFERAADAGVECYRALHRFARSTGRELPEVDSEALRSSLEVLFATLPDDDREWPSSIRAAFAAWGIAVPSHVGSSLLLDPQAFVGFQEVLREHNTLIPIEIDDPVTRPTTTWMREP